MDVGNQMLQYSYFSVISRPPLKTVHPFRSSLPPPTLYKVETRKKFWIHASNIDMWGEGRGWTCVNWKTPQKRKSVPSLLSMIVVFLSIISLRTSPHIHLKASITVKWSINRYDTTGKSRRFWREIFEAF